MSYMTAMMRLGPKLPLILFVFFTFSLFKAFFTMVLLCFGIMFAVTMAALTCIYLWTNRRKTEK